MKHIPCHYTTLFFDRHSPRDSSQPLSNANGILANRYCGVDVAPYHEARVERELPRHARVSHFDREQRAASFCAMHLQTHSTTGAICKSLVVEKVSGLIDGVLEKESRDTRSSAYSNDRS